MGAGRFRANARRIVNGDRIDVELAAEDLRDPGLGRVLRAAQGFPGTVSVAMPAELAVVMWEAVTVLAKTTNDAGGRGGAAWSAELRALVRSVHEGSR